MNTKEVCKMLDATIKTLIVYEEYGIVVPKREENNYRNYSEDDVLKLRTVKLLKELGFSLKDIKSLMEKNNYATTQFMRSLYLQLKAVETKMNELDHVKNTLVTSIDKMLDSSKAVDQDSFLRDMDTILKENKDNRRIWVDMWGFDNKAIKFDKMVRDSERDELGLFEKYDEILSEIRTRIRNHKAMSIIDIGCGTGNLCGELSADIDVVGIDQSLEMIVQAKKKYGDMKFRLGNFLDKPYRNKDVDIVVTTYAFHSLNEEEKKEAIDNMLEYIKEDGKIIIVDFMFLNDFEKEERKKEYYEKGRQDLWEVVDYKYYTNLEKLENYIHRLGCKMKKEHVVNFTWIVEIQN